MYPWYYYHNQNSDYVYHSPKVSLCKENFFTQNFFSGKLVCEVAI